MSNGRGRLAGVLCCAALAACAATARGDVQLDDLPRWMPSAERAPDDINVSTPDQRPLLAGRDRYKDEVDTAFYPPAYVAPYDNTSYPPAAGGCPAPSGGPQFPGALAYDVPWSWQLLPTGLIWHSYLAGVKEPRVANVFNYQKGTGWLWDPTIGARVGLLRYGTPNAFRPDGWQLDVEGAAFPELLVNTGWDLHSADFRVGVPLTYGVGPLQFKFAWYHLSSHLGDEFLIKNPDVQRINFSRNALVFGTSYFPTDNLRLYGEVGWAYYTDGGTKPWEFQFGAEYSPIFSPGFRGSPFAAVNGHLRQEVAFGGSLTVQIGWQWLNAATGTRLRFGFQYFNGKNEQYQFFNEFVQQYGIGLWYDF